jgi:hypothetical protein
LWPPPTGALGRLVDGSASPSSMHPGASAGMPCTERLGIVLGTIRGVNGPQSQHVASYLPCFALTLRELVVGVSDEPNSQGCTQPGRAERALA